MNIAQLNSLSRDEFVHVVGPVFEHSPWIVEATWPKRPFANVEELHRALCQTVIAAGEDAQLALIRAHPDLVAATPPSPPGWERDEASRPHRAALAGTLTHESTNEQASAGLGKLTPEEVALFRQNNAAYKEKFGFPFVICARLNKKEAILNGFKVRLQNSREQEVKAALDEVFKIAELRLRDLAAA